MPPSEIRKEAREALRGKWGKEICITLVFLVFAFLIGLIEGLVGERTALYTIIDLAFLVISIPLSFGLTISFMKLKRGEDVSALGFFKDGLSRFGKSWGIWAHTLLKLLLPIVCLILTILLMTALIILGNVTDLGIFLTIAGIVLYIATLIYVISRTFLYVLAYFIGYDNPELSSKACVLKSEALMKGNRGSYFLLELSFIGWALLATLTFGIGYLWLAPYMQVAVVCFYDKLANPETKKIEEEPKIEE